MSQENVELLRRLFAVFEPYGGRIEPDEIRDRWLTNVLGAINGSHAITARLAPCWNAASCSQR
jgi:hypothetical protein